MKKKIPLLMILFCSFLLIAGCTKQSAERPPQLTLQFPDGQEIDARIGTYEWEVKGFLSSQHIIADSASPYMIANELEPIVVKPNAIVTMQYSDGSTPTVNAYLWEQNVQGPMLVANSQQITLPSIEGKAIIEVQADWPTGNASYTFLVEVENSNDFIEETLQLFKPDADSSYVEPYELKYKGNEDELVQFIYDEVVTHKVELIDYTFSDDGESLVLDLDDGIFTVQGSSGGFIFAGAIVESYFANYPNLKQVTITHNGSYESILDHLLVGQPYTRANAAFTKE